MQARANVEVRSAVVGFIQNMEVFLNETDATKTIGTADKTKTADQVSAVLALFALATVHACCASNAIVAVRTFVALRAARAIVRTDKLRAVVAESAAFAPCALNTLNAGAIVRALMNFFEEFAQSGFELFEVHKWDCTGMGSERFD